MNIVDKKKHEFEYTVGRLSDGSDRQTIKQIGYDVMVEDDVGQYLFQFDHEPTNAEINEKYAVDKKDVSDPIWKLTKRVEALENKLKDKG